MSRRAAQRLSQIARSMSTASDPKPATSSPPRAAVSAVPSANPLGEGNYVSTASILIIGDEVLNGKTLDTNSNRFAKTCFDLGIELKRIEVIADDEAEIVEAARRMVSKYDLVFTSGGIGPTHDDITYASLAKAFDPEGKLEYHAETERRMAEFSKNRPSVQNQTEEQKKARRRMALFPVVGAEVFHAADDLWVPVVRLQSKLCILPGVPRLFSRLCDEFMARYVPLPPDSAKPYRHLIATKLAESSIAPYLTELANRVKDEGIRVGSYPKTYGHVEVSLIGKDQARLSELEKEVVERLQGTVVSQGKLGEEVKVG